MDGEQEDAATSRKPRLMLRYPHLASSRQRWDYLLGCLAARGGPTTWSTWNELIEPHEAFRKFVGNDLSGRFARWRSGERNVFTFLQKMAVLRPIADVLHDYELAWSAYWLESGSEPVSVRGMKATHVFPECGGQPILVTEPGKKECRGGPNIHDRKIAQAHIDSLLPQRKRGRPPKDSPRSLIQSISDGRHDFPPWYQRIDFQRRCEVMDRESWEMKVAEWEAKTGKKHLGEYESLPDVTSACAESVSAYGRCVVVRLGIYFKEEKWQDFSSFGMMHKPIARD